MMNLQCTPLETKDCMFQYLKKTDNWNKANLNEFSLVLGNFISENTAGICVFRILWQVQDNF